MKHKIILDCDPGHDDAIAILLAAHHPEIDLLAITTVAGNQSLEKTTRNALKVCSLANIRDVPVAKGMDRPLVRRARFAPEIHGESGMDGPDIPEPEIEPVPQHAVDLIVEKLMNSDGDITLVATGPLSNIATAIRREPAILPKIKAISLMGGAIGLWGSVELLQGLSVWQPIARFQSVHIPANPDGNVYVVALLLALASGFLFGAVPVRQVLLWRYLP